MPETNLTTGRDHSSHTSGGRLFAAGALLLLAVIWGYSWVVMKIALSYCPPFTFAALRTLLGSLVLFAALALTRRSLRPVALLPTAVLGLLQTAGFVGFLTWALSGGGAGRTSVLTYTMPFWLLILAWLFLGERLRGLQWVAVALAMAGLVLILKPWDMHGVFSSALAVAGAVFWAASAVFVKVMRKKHEVELLSLTAWQMILGSLPLLGAALTAEHQMPLWTGTFVAALVYVSVLGNAVAWILWLYVLAALPAGTAGLATLLTPVIGIVSAWIQLGETPEAVEGLGMLGIVAALLLTVVWGLITGRTQRSR